MRVMEETELNNGLMRRAKESLEELEAEAKRLGIKDGQSEPWMFSLLRWWIAAALRRQDEVWALVKVAADAGVREIRCLNVNLGGIAETDPDGHTFVEFATLSTERLRYREKVERAGPGSSTVVYIAPPGTERTAANAPKEQLRPMANLRSELPSDYD